MPRENSGEGGLAPLFHNHLGHRVHTQQILTGRLKLALFFPGLNYSLDLPLFHYLAQVFPAWGFDVLGVDLGYSRNLDYLAMTAQDRRAFQERDIESLAPMLSEYLGPFEDVVVVSKSLGSRLVRGLLGQQALNRASLFVWVTPAVEPGFVAGLPSSGAPSLFILGGFDSTYVPSKADLEPTDRVDYLTLPGATHSLDVPGDLSASLLGLQKVIQAIGRAIGRAINHDGPSAHVTGLDHVQVAIPVGSEPVARAFYCDQLGFPEVDKPANLKKKGGLWVQCGAHQLHIGVQDPFTPATKAHPAFAVQGIAGLRTRWEATGVAPRDEDELPGADRFYVSDPFGNRLEFLEWRTD